MIPVHVVTGFLGAGKTSLLNRLLRASELSNALVLVNEWGEIGLDHLLIEKLEGDVVLLASGCLCCSLRGDLVDALRGLLTRRDAGALRPFDRVVIETTGLADPAPILHALAGDAALASRLWIAGIVAVVDAVNGLGTLATHRESARQAALADVLAVAKSDLLGEGARRPAMFALGAALRALNPNAAVLDLAAGEFGVEEFLRERAGEIGSAPSEPHIAHDPRLRSFAFRAAQPASSPAIGEFLRRLSAALGPKLLRVKGLVAQAANPARPLAIHGVQHILHPPRLLAAWPDADRSTRIVAIAEGGEGEAIERLWRALTGPIEPDAPDLMALTSSPLAIRRAGLLGD